MGLKGYFERRALQRMERLLAPHLSPGEQVLDFDVGKSEVSGEVSERIDLIATTKALYVYYSRRNWVARYPYEEILAVAGPSPLWPLFFIRPTPRSRAREPVAVRLIGTPRGMVTIVKQKVQDLVQFERHVAHRTDGAGATYRLRPWEENGDLIWDIRFDSEIEDAGSNMQEAMRETMRNLDKELVRSGGGNQL